VGEPNAPGICSKFCADVSDCPTGMGVCSSISDSAGQKLCLPGDPKTAATDQPKFTAPKPKPVTDGGVSDGGGTTADSGTTTQDAGGGTQTGTDAGTTGTDAGASDAGTKGTDAGTGATDAGASDAGKIFKLPTIPRPTKK
jgi:hypothetical protein